MWYAIAAMFAIDCLCLVLLYRLIKRECAEVDAQADLEDGILSFDEYSRRRTSRDLTSYREEHPA